MANTYTSGMTVISACDAATNFNSIRFSGTGQFAGASLDTTVTKDGGGSIGTKMNGNNWVTTCLFDWYSSTEGGKSANATVNLTTAGNEIVSMWVLNTSPTASLARASDGMTLIVSSSTESVTSVPTVYSEWTFSGADIASGAWQLWLLDTSKTPTIDVGGGCDLTAVRRIGVVNRNVSSVPNVKSDNVFVDAMFYGLPKYTLAGDGTTVANWNEFLTASLNAVDGLIEEAAGSLYCSCGIRYGTAAQSSTTTFTDTTGRGVVFREHVYYDDVGAVVPSIDYATTYIIDALGNGTTRTSVTLGQVVGTGDSRQGVQGGSIRTEVTAGMTWKLDFQTDAADLEDVKLYGVDLVGAKAGILLDKVNNDTVAISVAAVNCGEIDPGQTGTSPDKGAEMLNMAVIDPEGGTAANRGLRMYDVNRVSKVSLITSGTPSTQHMTHHSEGGTITVEYDAIKYYGTYNGTTLWHGETSTASAAVTVSATNEADPNETYMDDTGAAASTTVQNDVNVTLTNVVIGSYYEVRRTDNGSLIMSGTAATATPSTTYNYPGSEVGVTIKVRKATIAPKYKRYRRTDVITGSGMSHQVAQVLDTLAS